MFNIRFWQKFLFFTPFFFLSTSIVFAAITVVSGGKQTIMVGELSEEIVFKVVDELGNSVTVGTPVSFEFTDSQGEVVTGGLSANSSVTDTQGQIVTRINTSNAVGQYTLTANVQIGSVIESVSTTAEITAGNASTLAVTAGDNQTITAGSASDSIGFKLTDGADNPIKGERIDFTLITPSGESSRINLSPNSSTTDTGGQALTNILSTATDTIGGYLVTATLAKDSTISVQANITVVAGIATKLTVISGANQTIVAGSASDDLRFKLTDNVGNPLAGKRVDFMLTTPNGNTTNQGLLPAFSTSSINGEVNTRLEASVTNNAGTYTIKASLASNETVTAQVALEVSEEVPDLPSLGFCGAVNTSGLSVNTTAICNGGISVRGTPFEQEATLKLTDPVLVQGVIKVDSNHVKQLADLIVVAGYKPPPPDDAVETFYMMNSLGQIQDWDLNIASLVAFRHSVTLTATQIINMYRGNFIARGTLRVYFGYRLVEGQSNGMVVFNANQTIDIDIK
jgi:hypothetical protein